MDRQNHHGWSFHFETYSIQQSIDLWIQLRDLHLNATADDTIIWNLSTNGDYSSSLAYNVPFLGTMLSNMNRRVWKNWAPLKIKFFAWLALQYRLWTDDCLANCGWPNCGLCLLSKQALKLINQLLVNCRFSICLWVFIKDWMDRHPLDLQQWSMLSFKAWWWKMSVSTPNRKVMTSLAMLVSWEIWNEINSSVLLSF
jgi:hypothetical protein